MKPGVLRFCFSCQSSLPAIEFYVDRHRKDGLQRQCKTCIKRRTAARHIAKPEVKKRNDSEYYQRNRQNRIKYALAYEKQNKEKHKLSATKWRLQKEDFGAYWANYKARKLQATPKWGNRFFIAEAYSLAKLRSKVTGIKWHVDHIVPLKSKKVCGLHWEQNLQLLPAKENISKGNRLWPNK